MSLFTDSDFDYEVIGDVVVIWDLDHGGRSVTSDIQKILAMISEDMDLQGKTVIYRNSQKIFDGIQHRKGTFKSFYSINETVLEKALNKVNRVHAIH